MGGAEGGALFISLPKAQKTLLAALYSHNRDAKEFLKCVSQQVIYWGADKSLARPTSRCILFDGKNISFDASLVIHINSTNVPLIMIINRMYEN